MTARDYGRADMDRVDELAVRWACQGTAMRLNHDEQVVAVTWMLGRVPAAEIGRRINAHPRMLGRIVAALDTVVCPLCRCRALHDGGVLRRHLFDKPDTVGWCPMSGCHHGDVEALRQRAGWSWSALRRSRRRAVPA